MKKLFAGLSVAAIMSSTVGTALAAYSDVPAGVWYEAAVKSMTAKNILDATQTRFRGTDNAVRAEFAKVVVALNGGILNTAPAVPSFDDVPATHWSFPSFEEAGKEGWIRGDKSCYGTHPCYVRPGANINRAEAAAIIVRAFGLQPTGAAAKFVDNPDGQWYTADIQTAADHCVLQGDDATGRVRPSDNMNRAEMVVMLDRVDQNLTYGKDCGQNAQTGAPKVKAATAVTATTIDIDFNVDVDQTAATDKTKYTVTGSPALPIDSVKMLSSNSVELTLSAAMEAGHQYTVSVVDMKTAAGTTFSDSVTFSGYTTIQVGNGTLEVTLSAKNPVGDTVPKGAQGITFTSVDLTAVGDNVVLENLTVLHEGFGQAGDFSGVYALVDGARVTRKRTIDSQSYTANLRFTKPLTVMAGKTVTLQIAGDLNTTAATSGEHALSIELPSDFISNAKTVQGNFPLKGKMFRTAAVTAGTLSIQYNSVTPSNIKVGDVAAKIGKFQVSLNSVEDQTIYSMTLKNDGTAGDGDFTNIVIRRSDGTVVTKAVGQTTGDFVTLVFDPPFTVLEGDNISFSVTADIKGGSAKNIKLNFDETGDIFSVGSLYGYGVNGQLYGAQVALPANAGSTQASTVSIDAGQFTISIDGPATQQYTRKSKAAVLANIWFETGGDDVDVQQLYALVEGTTSTGAAFKKGRAQVTTADEISEVLERVELRNTVTGRTISGVRLTASGDSGTVGTTGTASGTFQVYRFDDFVVHGKEKYEFRVNFIDNSGAGANAAPANGDKFRVHICGEGKYITSAGALVANTTYCTLGGYFVGGTTSNNYQMDIKGVSTNDRIGDYRPRGTLTGNFQEVRTAGLTLSGKATATTDTTVRNAKDIPLLRFEALAAQAKDILITNLIFGKDSASASLVNASNYSLWVDSNNDGKVDTVLQKGVAAQSQQITFDKITGGGYVIPKSKSVIFEVHADIASSLTTSSPVLAIRFDTGATFISAEQVDDGTSLSGIQTKDPFGNTVASNGSYTNGGSTADIQVTTAYATQYTVRNQGDLYVTKSNDPVKSTLALAGKLGKEVLKLQFSARFESIDVKNLVFTASGANASSFKTDVSRVELYRVGATTPFAVATTTGCGNDAVASNSVCARLDNQEFVVDKDSDTNILVRPLLQDGNAATSGNKWALMLDPTPSTTTGSVRATGMLSSQPLSANNGDSTAAGEVFVGTATAAANARIVGNVNYVSMSKVVSITNADPNNNGTAIPTGTQRAIGQFKFATDPQVNSKNGAVFKFTLSGVIFNVNATNVQLGTGLNTSESTSTFKLYNKADSSVKATCTAAATSVSNAGASGSLVVTCPRLQQANVNTTINPGTDATFVLEAEIANAKISNGSTSTLQVSLQSFSDNPYYATFASSASHLVWVDKNGTVATTFRWLEYPDTSINGTSYTG